MGHQKERDARRGYAVLVQWADGTVTWNDLGKTFQDNPISISLYAQKKGLLDTPGWKDCKGYTWNPRKLARAIN